MNNKMISLSSLPIISFCAYYYYPKLKDIYINDYFHRDIANKIRDSIKNNTFGYVSINSKYDKYCLNHGCKINQNNRHLVKLKKEILESQPIFKNIDIENYNYEYCQYIILDDFGKTLRIRFDI